MNIADKKCNHTNIAELKISNASFNNKNVEKIIKNR